MAALALAGIGLLGGCGGSDGSTASAGPSTTVRPVATRDVATPPKVAPGEVIKDVLATTVDPPGAPGRTLTLIRYTIGAGAKLAPHIHPGVQLASITSGRLSYTVVEGTATVRRAGSKTDEQVTAPATITLGPGDAVTEVDGMVHFGANETKKPIVITATLLTRDGEDLAVPATTAPAGG